MLLAAFVGGGANATKYVPMDSYGSYVLAALQQKSLLFSVIFKNST